MCVCVGGGGTLIFAYIWRLGPFFKILYLNIIGGGGPENAYFLGYEDFVDNLLRSPQFWIIFGGHFYTF